MITVIANDKRAKENSEKRGHSDNITRGKNVKASTVKALKPIDCTANSRTGPDPENNKKLTLLSSNPVYIKPFSRTIVSHGSVAASNL